MNIFIKTLKFLNLLEYDRNVISISNTYMWVMLILLICVLIWMPDNLTAVVGAVGGVATGIGNYAHKKWMIRKNKDE